MKALFKGMLILLAALGLIFIFVIRKNPEKTKQPAKPKLESLSYLTWVKARQTLNKRGVVSHLKGDTQSGLNFYNSRDQSVANLMDMEGGILHQWEYPWNSPKGWHHVHIFPNGHILAIIKDEALLCLNWNSDLVWRYDHRFHHDISIDDRGDIFILSRKEGWVWREGWPFPVILDLIIVLSPEGSLKREIPLYPLFQKFIPLQNFHEIYHWFQFRGSLGPRKGKRRERGGRRPMTNPPDVLHTNSLQVINRTVEGLCRKGDILLSLREIDMIAIIDSRGREIRWSWGPGILKKQHHPTLMENNHILVFDNGDSLRRYSRIVELNPMTGEIAWSYRGDNKNPFYSNARGSCQRLPNGNTLITDSESGRVLEVETDGRIVWHFFNPRLDMKSKTRAAIYRMIRLWDTKKYPFLNQLKPKPGLSGNK